MKKEAFDKGMVAAYQIYMAANPNIKTAMLQEQMINLKKKAFEFNAPNALGGLAAGAITGYGVNELLNRKKIQELEAQLANAQQNQITGMSMYSPEELAQNGYYAQLGMMGEQDQFGGIDPSLYGAYYQ